MSRFLPTVVFILQIACGASLYAQDRTGLHPTAEPFETGYLKVGDIHEIYYECRGNPKGKPVMALHGGPGVGCYPRMAQYFNHEKFLIVLHDQRGSQRSRPRGELRENTTWDLVEDIETLRKHLKLGKVLVFGGSWGTTLALAYAETHPDSVSAMLLRGIFLGTEEEIEFHYLTTGHFFPEEHHALQSLLPEPEKGTHPDYLHELIRGPDKELANRVSWALARFELKFMKLRMPDERVEGFLRSIPENELHRSQCLDLHYVTNRYFLEEGQLLANTDRIKHLPVTLISGRYDMACPPSSAFKVHQRLPKSKLILVEEAGHSESEEGITAALVKAAAEFE